MRRPVAALLALWGQMVPAPLDLLLCEIAELDRRLEAEHEARWKLLFFGTLAIAVLVLRIPGVVLKEQIPKLRHLVIAVSLDAARSVRRSMELTSHTPCRAWEHRISLHAKPLLY